VAKIADFGASRFFAKNNSSNSNSHMTKYVGTSAFMAPELVAVENPVYDEKCDVFSFAIIMFLLYTGTTQPYAAYEQAQYANIEVCVARDPNFRPKLPPNDFTEQEEQDRTFFIELIVAEW